MLTLLLVKGLHRLRRRYSQETCMRIGKEVATYPVGAFYATVLYFAFVV